MNQWTETEAGKICHSESYTLSDYLLRNRLSDAVSGAGRVSVPDARSVPRIKRAGLETGHLDPDSAG